MNNLLVKWVSELVSQSISYSLPCVSPRWWSLPRVTWWCHCHPGVQATGVPWASASPWAVCVTASLSAQMVQMRRAATGRLRGSLTPSPTANTFPHSLVSQGGGSTATPSSTSHMVLAKSPHPSPSSLLPLFIAIITFTTKHQGHCLHLHNCHLVIIFIAIYFFAVVPHPPSLLTYSPTLISLIHSLTGWQIIPCQHLQRYVMTVRLNYKA